LIGFIVTLYSYHTGFYFSGAVALFSAVYFYLETYRRKAPLAEVE